MRSFPISWLRTALLPLVPLATLALLERPARADDAPLGLSISLERAAGVAFASARPTSGSDSLSATTFGLAGPAINPIALPRAGADVILPMGMTLGGSVAYGYASLTDTPDSGTGSTLHGAAWLISPRVGYLAHLGPFFDLWPRVGLTFAGANVKGPDSESCSGFSTPSGQFTQSCTSTPGETDSVFFTAISVELAAALRLTRSFNLLGGISYDQVISASGSTSQTSGTNTESTDLQPQGRYLGGQLWFGLGGYVL
jgi:hypothetical protein